MKMVFDVSCFNVFWKEPASNRLFPFGYFISFCIRSLILCAIDVLLFLQWLRNFFRSDGAVITVIFTPFDFFSAGI